MKRVLVRLIVAITMLSSSLSVFASDIDNDITEENQDSKKEIRQEVVEYLGKETTDKIEKYLLLVRSWYDEYPKTGDMNMLSVEESYEDAGLEEMGSEFYEDERLKDALADYDVTEEERKFLEVYMPCASIGGQFAEIMMTSVYGGNIEEDAWEKLGDCIRDAEEYYYEGIKSEESTEEDVEEAFEEIAVEEAAVDK